jgi:hypothetical protein
MGGLDSVAREFGKDGQVAERFVLERASAEAGGCPAEYANDVSAL